MAPISAGQWSEQRNALETWLAVESKAKWTAGSAVAALEAWRVSPAVPADMRHKMQLAQEYQFGRVLGVPFMPPYIKVDGNAYGDVWKFLEEAAAAARGAAVEIPTPSQALCDAVVARYWKRVRDSVPNPLPPPLDPTKPRKPRRSLSPAVVLAVLAMALAYTTTKGE